MVHTCFHITGHFLNSFFPELSLSGLDLSRKSGPGSLTKAKKNSSQIFFTQFASSDYGYTSWCDTCHHGLIFLTFSECNHNFSILPSTIFCLLFIRFDLRTVAWAALSPSHIVYSSPSVRTWCLTGFFPLKAFL